MYVYEVFVSFLQLFYSCLLDLQTDGLLCEIRTEELFSNVLELAQCSKTFWVNHMSHALQMSRRTHALLNPSLLTEGFMKVGTSAAFSLRGSLEHHKRFSP